MLATSYFIELKSELQGIVRGIREHNEPQIPESQVESWNRLFPLDKGYDRPISHICMGA